MPQWSTVLEHQVSKLIFKELIKNSTYYGANYGAVGKLLNYNLMQWID